MDNKKIEPTGDREQSELSDTNKKSLLVLRNELAKIYYKRKSKDPWITGEIDIHFMNGFDACHTAMLEHMKVLVDALEFYADPRTLTGPLMARSALEQHKEFMGAK